MKIYIIIHTCMCGSIQYIYIYIYYCNLETKTGTVHLHYNTYCMLATAAQQHNSITAQQHNINQAPLFLSGYLVLHHLAIVL